MYELLEHTADIRLRIRAADLEELFRDSIKGLAAAYLEAYDEEMREREANATQKLSIEADSLEELVHKLLQRAVALFDINKMLPYDLSLEELCYRDGYWRLVATVKLVKIPQEEISVYVKAVTYHGYQLTENYEYEVVLDI